MEQAPPLTPSGLQMYFHQSAEQCECCVCRERILVCTSHFGCVRGKLQNTDQIDDSTLIRPPPPLLNNKYQIPRLLWACLYYDYWLLGNICACLCGGYQAGWLGGWQHRCPFVCASVSTITCPISPHLRIKIPNRDTHPLWYRRHWRGRSLSSVPPTLRPVCRLLPLHPRCWRRTRRLFVSVRPSCSGPEPRSLSVGGHSEAVWSGPPEHCSSGRNVEQVRPGKRVCRALFYKNVLKASR